jgi:peptidoglycan L-alanyl-D-glutamate endopeptidase CwlK
MPFDPLDHLRHRDGRWRVDPALLYPPFRDRLLGVIARCHERGEDYFATSGQRGWSEQADLYRKHLAGGPRAAPPGYSSHWIGGAVDLAPDADEGKPGLQGPAYKFAAYTTLVEEAQRAGLVSGRSFNDDPHVQIPTFVSGRDLQPLRKLWAALEGATEAEKMGAMWRYLDVHLVWSGSRADG